MTRTAFRGGLLTAVSIATLAGAGAAQASDNAIARPVAARDIAANAAPTGAEDVPGIIVRDDLNPNALPPAGALDPVNINGVGQMVVDQQNGFLGTCTGTLINPRTVLFAAHCVNSRAADAYGAATGGTPISFGFQQNNVPGLLNWLGRNDPAAIYQTNEATAIYNVEHVWYDERSLVGTFIQADVALATLDTPASDIPTWAMLFTPLDQQEHVTVTGYGNIGTGSTGQVASGGFRRRAAENFVSMLGSLDDRNQFLFGSGSFAQNHYNVALTDPNGRFGTPGSFDFGLYGANDVALPREGSTAQGDSGSPLILDEKYAEQLVIGVLSGGSRFFGPQPFGAYGTQAFYQPLHAFWDVIVANNPYVYATNKVGIGDWTDPGHWIQAMDPSYRIDLNGELINALPSTPGEGIDGSGAKFGDICFLDDCQDFQQDPVVVADGVNQFFVEGGPGSENFVPDNRVADPSQGIRPRYFDVTLSAFGATYLKHADVTIDKLTVNGPTSLFVGDGASLNVLTDFNQIVGLTHVDGTLAANEVFVLSGIVSGSGTIRTPFFTSASGLIAPGGAFTTGSLRIDGNAILASGTVLNIDLARRSNDSLDVTGILSLSDVADPSSTGAGLLVTPGAGQRARWGQTFTIATAGGGVEGTFGTVGSLLGFLRPELTYGENEVTATLRAARFSDFLSGASLTAQAFGAALDQLRTNNYDALYNLYGTIDLMGLDRLALTLDGLAPKISLTGNTLQQRQSRLLGDAVSDRLSIIGSGAAPRMSLIGSPETLRFGALGVSGHSVPSMGMAGLVPGSDAGSQMPEGFSGFVAGGSFGGVQRGAAQLSGGDQYGSYFGMGIEHRVSEKASFGMAIGYADGNETTGLTQGRVRTTQVAAYGAHDLGGNAYIGGVASMEEVELRNERSGFDGEASHILQGATGMQRYALNAELGVNLPLGRNLTLTPRAQLGYDRVRLEGYEEQGGEIALAIDSLSAETLTVRTGFKLAGTQSIARGWTLSPQLKADYVQRLGGADSGLTVRFAAADDVGILLPLAQGEGGWGEVRGGFTLDNGPIRFGAGFETAIDRHAIRDDRATVEFAIDF